MSLAFTQEDCLVIIYKYFLICSLFILNFSLELKWLYEIEAVYVFMKLPFNQCLFIKFVTQLQQDPIFVWAQFYSDYTTQKKLKEI